MPWAAWHEEDARVTTTGTQDPAPTGLPAELFTTIDHVGIAVPDLDEAIAGFVVFRDAPGTPADDPDAHGSAFQRIGAFQDGVINGAQACAPYAS